MRAIEKTSESSSASWAAPHAEALIFDEIATFQAFVRRSHPQWSDQVEQALRLIALNGIREPLTQAVIPADALQVSPPNFRESLSHLGVLSRHRAVLFLLEQRLASGQLPPLEQLDLYLPEAVTAFAALMQRLCPGCISSEYLPDPSDPQREHLRHEDLCRLSLEDACMDLVICNDLFEHLYDLPAALREIARVLRPGGQLIATFPFAYTHATSIVKARHRPGATPGVASQAELLCETEFHGNPVDPEQGSLVYQIPGWDVLDQARDAGLEGVAMNWVAAPSHGVVGQEIPAVLVMTARGV